jgi:hypothetical protein
MAETNPTDCDRDPAHPRTQDANAERIVLAFLLKEHPSQLTIPEVSRALNADPGGFRGDDAVERAIRELNGAGLVRCASGLAVPTRPALYFAGLDLD